MMEDGHKRALAWLKNKFYYTVESSSLGIATFQEAIGLDTELPAMSYGHGKSKASMMPGMPSSGQVTLKRGRIQNENMFYAWCEVMETAKAKPASKPVHPEMKKNLAYIPENVIQRTYRGKTVIPESVKIMLLDDSGSTVMAWTLKDAQPLPCFKHDLTKLEGNQLAVETFILAHHGSTLSMV